MATDFNGDLPVFRPLPAWCESGRVEYDVSPRLERSEIGRELQAAGPGIAAI